MRARVEICECGVVYQAVPTTTTSIKSVRGEAVGALPNARRRAVTTSSDVLGGFREARRGPRRRSRRRSRWSSPGTWPRARSRGERLASSPRPRRPRFRHASLETDEPPAPARRRRGRPRGRHGRVRVRSRARRARAASVRGHHRGGRPTARGELPETTVRASLSERKNVGEFGERDRRDRRDAGVVVTALDSRHAGPQHVIDKHEAG